MYDQKLADRILEVLNEAYPEKLQSETELQSRLTEYQGTPQEEWFKALDALHGDGLIDGKFLRTGIDQKLQGAALLSITRAGREWLRARLTVQGSLSSVGEPTVESYDFRSILPETPTIPEGISAESANLLVCAFDLTEGSAELEEFNFSFTSILVAFLASDDPLSRWFQSFAAQHESQFEQLLKHRNVSRARLDEVRAKKPDASNIQRVLNRKPRPTWTSSAQAVLTAANDLKRSVSVPGSTLDVRHMMGVYIYRPSGHEKQLEEWGFRREEWSTGFLAQIATTNQDEVPSWISVHVSIFGSTPTLPDGVKQEAVQGEQQPQTDAGKGGPSREIPSGSGPSTHVARDRWTIDDSLGHFPYAYAIYRFLTDRETRPPLAISIQAPWGGGKSSLMRMIQSQLDPDALKDEKERAEPAKATVRDVVKEIEPDTKNSQSARSGPVKQPAQTATKGVSKDFAGRFQVPDLKHGGKRRVTIWFNAWKYESTAQVWAGLADCIIQQIGDRLGPVERELFWFRLQLRRIDVGKVRRRIHDEVIALFFEKLLPALWKYAIGPGLALLVAIAGRIAHWDLWQDVGWTGLFTSCLVDFALASAKLKEARSEVDKNPARMTLGEFMEAPDYRANLGFVHEVVEDLKRVFRIIPTKYLPMVIFIDDLDRCSPAKVADVVEALNLFLAGEFPDCMFVLGIDDEMVAAALDKAHSEVIAKLPGYARSASIGWRFMDKFVQLPFIVPLPGDEELNHYMESLLSQGSTSGSLDMEAREQAARAVEKGEDDPGNSDRVVEQVAGKKPLTDEQRGALKKEVEILQDMSRNIKNFSDRDDGIRNLILTGGRQFSNNPREMKRFVNVFRFFYFLRAAREARKEPVPSLQQMSRWIVLSLRWPELVRWLRRGNLAKGSSSDPVLGAFERLASESSDLAAWLNGADSSFGLRAGEVPWLSDGNLFEFFRVESGFAAGQRLSDATGKGFW